MTFSSASLEGNCPSELRDCGAYTHSVLFPLQTWSEHVNVQKALLPGLWSLLNAGGYGSAKVAYPCLLPFLRELVKQVRYILYARCFHASLVVG